MKLLDSPNVTPHTMSRYAGVLTELVGKGKTEEAAALAWTTLEGLESRFEAEQIVPAMANLLLAAPDTPDLRKKAADLYRVAYAGRANLDALIEQAGLEGGRPVRRALRTLDVCTALEPGSYVAARNEDAAARVDAIAAEDWSIRYTSPQGSRSLDPVRFADQFAPVDASDFRVMRCFDPAGLAARVADDPAWVVVSLCKLHGNRIDSDQLEHLLTPDLVAPSDWKNWWGKARTALKRVPQISVEGRNPHYLSYDVSCDSVEAQVWNDFQAQRNPLKRWALVEQYVRECRQHAVDPDAELLARFHERYVSDAARHIKAGAGIALQEALLAARSARLVGADQPASQVQAVLAAAAQPVETILALGDDGLVSEAFDALKPVRPDDWPELFAEALPRAPMNVCDNLTASLIEFGYRRGDFEPIVQRILASPLEFNEALLWLWNGPARETEIVDVPPLTLLTRILGVLSDFRRDHEVDTAVARERAARARTVLALRGYDRFERCLAGMERGVAHTLRTQINRLDSLGRTVPEEMLRRINRKFPKLEERREVKPWLREDVLYVTHKGMSRRRAELDEHVNVKMKENARAIGEAAAKGDLSENSEYKFALEERDLLRGRLAMMNAEMGMAQVIHPDDVPTDHAGIGSRVALRRADSGETLVLCIVDPWIADIERHLYNYKTPLAQAVLGKKVGETVELHFGDVAGTYQVAELGNAIRDGL